MDRKPARVFLSVQPVSYRKPAGTDPFTYREKRPLRYRASWWTRGTSTEMYRGKIVATREEAVRLALKWLDRWNKDAATRPASVPLLIDTTDQPQRYGYSHEATGPAGTKSAAQLDAEIAETIGKEPPR